MCEVLTFWLSRCIVALQDTPASDVFTDHFKKKKKKLTEDFILFLDVNH